MKTEELTVISSGGEDLALLGRDDSVTSNELGEDSTGGLDTEGKRADIDKNEVLSAFFTGEDTTLDGSAVSDSLIRVDALGGLLAAEVFLEELLDLGDTGGTTDENNLKTINICAQDEDSRRLTSLISSFLTLASLRTCSTGFIVLRKRSMFNSSNLARVKVSEKSLPSSKLSISRRVLC